MAKASRHVLAGIAMGLAALASSRVSWAAGQEQYVEFAKSPTNFAVADSGKAAVIYVDDKEWPGVKRAATDLSHDIKDVTGDAAEVISDRTKLAAMPIIVGTVGRGGVIDQLASSGKIDVSKIKGKWESYFTQVVENPLPGVTRALVIVGADKRGTIYGIYDLSEESGQSPWYYWADVPARKHAGLYVKAGKYEVGEPSVKYRGIFFNDESPALSNYIKEKYGSVPVNNDAEKGPLMPGGVANYGHEFYSHVFELLLRCKGNYMWPAMWNNAFNEDDTENAPTADMYGIVMGTSHQEAMLRAQKEWDRRSRQGWNYARDPEGMNKFWTEGLERNKNYESILTMGLRGENDTAMVQGQQQAIDLLNKIIPAQRKLIAETVNPDVAKVPQMWCLYKEVQNYYETGKLNPPDDITLLWAEDNNGNVRRLPTDAERKRSGGAGIYYHFDYHGSPTDYRWIDTSPVPRIWDQMSLAQQYGADRIWIVNVGKFKNLELPIDYFLHLGWDAKKWTNDNTFEFQKEWAAQQFGAEYADQTADILATYTRYNGRRKPERLGTNIYSPASYHEIETVAADYNALADRAQKLFEKMPPEQKNAFYELVLFPVKACANLNEMYMAGELNQLYAQQGRVSANDYAALVQADFDKDAKLMSDYNKGLEDGKWDHFQDDVHIGYTSWQEPPRPSLVRVPVTQVTPLAKPTMGVAVEGSASAWPGEQGTPELMKFNSVAQQKKTIDLFNKGTGAVDYTATPSTPWIVVSDAKGSVEKDKRLWVSIDWNLAPTGELNGTVKIIGNDDASVEVKVTAFNSPEVTRENLSGFVEGDGVVSIEPEHFSAKTDGDLVKWERVEGYGRTLSAMRVQGPVNFAAITPGPSAPSLEYKAYFFTSGAATVWSALAPNLDFIPGRELRYAVSIDNGAPQMVTGVTKGFSSDSADWSKNAQDEARWVSASVTIPNAGYHTLRFYAVDPGITMQKIVVDLGGFKNCYLGAPESYRSAK